MLIREIMSTNLITIAPSTPLATALSLMREHNVRRLPVVEDGRLVGILTDRDVRSLTPSYRSWTSTWEAETRFRTAPASEVMSRPVITVSPETRVEDAASLIVRQKIGGLPVVENGRLVGIVTDSDLLRLLIRLAASPLLITEKAD